MSDILTKIVDECIYIEKQIKGFYAKVSKNLKDERLKKFWNSLSKEKEKHISHLHKVLVYVKQGSVPQIFSHPFELYEELKNIKENLDNLFKGEKNFEDVDNIIFLSYFAEFQVINEAFALLYQLEIPGVGSIEGDVYRYQSRFNKMMKNFSKDKLRYMLLGNTLKKLWKYISYYMKGCEIDNLTGLLSRQGILRKTAPWIEMLVRDKKLFSIILIDIDNLKSINDKYDYKEGDRVLKFAANEIVNVCRKSDIAGRFGGDEFLVFMPSCKKKDIEKIAERIRKNIEDKSKEANLKVDRITVSIGGVLGCIESRRNVSDSFQKFVDFAENLLQKIKKNGGNGSAVFKMDNSL